MKNPNRSTEPSSAFVNIREGKNVITFSRADQDWVGRLSGLLES